MYSALLVVPDRKAYNPDMEKVVLLGGAGPASADFGRRRSRSTAAPTRCR
jgi:hypothetical protein